MIKHIGVFAAMALALSGCVDRPVATQEQQDSARRAYISCLRMRVAELDDGVSDAASVALAASGVCGPEYQRAIDAAGSDLNPAARRIFEARMEDKRVSLATATVLQMRRAELPRSD